MCAYVCVCSAWSLPVLELLLTALKVPLIRLYKVYVYLQDLRLHPWVSYVCVCRCACPRRVHVHARTAAHICHEFAVLAMCWAWLVRTLDMFLSWCLHARRTAPSGAHSCGCCLKRMIGAWWPPGEPGSALQLPYLNLRVCMIFALSINYTTPAHP